MKIRFFFVILLSLYTKCDNNILWGTWVPYWKVESGTSSVIKHIKHFQQVSPFSYEVRKDGSLIDKFNRKKDLWESVYKACRDNNTSIIPTIFWTKPEEIHECLSNTKKCYQHVEDIIDIVNKNNFDGINIDYECVDSDDKDNFIIFMEMLSKKLHNKNKILACSIGAQTSDTATGIYPWKPLPKNSGPQNTTHIKPKKVIDKISLRNYQKKLASLCDQIHLMAYDEWGAPCLYSPIHLHNKYYVSHSSNQWVEKIIQYALTYIPKDKLILCIPTYGLEFKVLHVPSGRRKELRFAKSRSLGWSRAEELAKEKKQVPKRTAGGELAFVYHTEDKDKDNNTRYVCYLDQKALKDKINLANKYKLKGLYLFKIDGTEPDALWPIIK